MESTSEYKLQKNMTFQVDTFFYDHDFGLRWENGLSLRKEEWRSCLQIYEGDEI